jgi:hypothetical protein
MNDLPELSREFFEILAVRELRKAGFEVGVLRAHRHATLPEPARGYLLELGGVVSRGAWQVRLLIACRRQETPIGRAAVEDFATHRGEAGVEAGILFGAPDFAPDALQAAEHRRVVLLRVTDGRTAFDTSGWGTPGHYPVWLPAYCAQVVGRDMLGQARYQLLEAAAGEAIVRQLQAPAPTASDRDSTPQPN